MGPSNPNPYAPPQSPLQPSPAGGLSEGVCPRCQSPNVYRPKFTWWGGALGPKLLSHTICRGCGFGFSWKTGKSNTTGIAIYTAVAFVIAFALVFAIRSM
jgi:hypothetical protein